MHTIGVISTHINVGVVVINDINGAVGVIDRRDGCKICTKHQKSWLSDWLELVGPSRALNNNK
jgi:hypothetical protein